MNVPLLDLQAQYALIRDEVRAAIDRVCDAQHFILGPEVAALEEEVARHCGAGFAIGVSSGERTPLPSTSAYTVPDTGPARPSAGAIASVTAKSVERCAVRIGGRRATPS